MEPLVSILIPAYNAERWIADTIRSAIAQTWRRKELIVVDDGSTDQTLKVAQRFASRQTTVVSQQNQGASAARNRALSLCQGDYIQWLDADDLLSPHKIRRQIEISQQYCDGRILFSSGWGHFAHRTARSKFRPTSLWRDLTPIQWLLHKMAGNLHMQTATWLVSRELTEVAGPWDIRLVNDNDGEYFCRVILASAGIRFVPEAKVFYRVTPPRRASYIGRSNEKKDARFLSMQLHVKYIRSIEESARVRTACLTYLQNWLIYFYPERPDIVEGLQKLAGSLGGNLEVPRLRWKYAWIKPLFGWDFAKRAEFQAPQLKLYLIRSWDRVMHFLERTASGGNFKVGLQRPGSLKWTVRHHYGESRETD